MKDGMSNNGPDAAYPGAKTIDTNAAYNQKRAHRLFENGTGNKTPKNTSTLVSRRGSKILK